MMKRFPQLAISLNALVFGVAACMFLFVPTLPLSLLGLEDIPAAALTDIRAMYGGLELGIAVYLALCALKSTDFRNPLGMCMLLYAGFIVGRLYGFIAAGEVDKVNLVLVSLEITGLVFSAFAFQQTPKSEST